MPFSFTLNLGDDALGLAVGAEIGDVGGLSVGGATISGTPGFGGGLNIDFSGVAPTESGLGVFGGSDRFLSRGDDVIIGSEGRDNLRAGVGDDTFFIQGDDTVLGGNGFDTVVFTESVDLRDIASNQLRSIEAIRFAEGVDGLGSNGDDNLVGSDGDDKFQGRPGDDTISGGAGNDDIDGDRDDDLIFGEAGNDIVEGDQGNDTLDGGVGNDQYRGGSGADVFVFTGDDFGNDVITDFNVNQGDSLLFVDVDLTGATLSVSEEDRFGNVDTTLTIGENSIFFNNVDFEIVAKLIELI